VPEQSNSPGEPAGAGTRVRQSGIGLVHKDELILPAAGSAAELEPSRGDREAAAQYVFPVEVEVLAPGEPPDLQEFVDVALTQLARTFEAL
jgi:hypothetical protein